MAQTLIDRSLVSCAEPGQERSGRTEGGSTVTKQEAGTRTVKPGFCPGCLSSDAKHRGIGGECAHEWHTIPKTRYLLGPYEDERPVALMSLESAIDHLKAFFHDHDGGDEAHFRIIELSDAEVEAIPEL